jgi:hypothetical protein
VTYFAYALLAFDLILFFLFNYRSSVGSIIHYVVLIINLCLIAGMLYFTIDGYNRFNNSAQSKALY